ncbi:right-handed parallel beta-helix repeat-containing protein [Methylobacterium goesingense]|uniref:Pel9A-like right handed beta-helix region domain-containing protein n=1 Tax=Methylobacterium goesingense TaxID=243690 RepID=A0ABV2L8W0_9HYPH|nr:right-handed parallel beta-helix repeat-containing protein [Methylobacterium goesingense]GJD75738.1 Pectate lyase L [Methylobacterium goesingense]
MITRRSFLLGTGGLLLAGAVAARHRPVANAKALHVAPYGKDEDEPGHGTLKRPYATLHHAYARAGAGDTILLRGGVYGFGGRSSGWVLAGGGGVPGRPLRIEAYPGETPVLDGSDLRPPDGPYAAWPSRGTAGGFPLVFWDTPYVEVAGLTVRNGPLGGCHVNGSHPGFKVERCRFHDNGWLNDEHGVGLGLYGTGDGNVVRNCDAFGNHGGGADATGSNADGFQISLADSTGTVVAGNRAWRNTDDGFDFFSTLRDEDTRGVTGYFVDGNWSFENGHRVDGTMAPKGDGNGFKLGGRRRGARSRHGGHTIIRNLSWANKSNGFDDNGSAGGIEPLQVWNNVSLNDARNVDPSMGDPGYAFVFVSHPDTVLGNNIAFATEGRNEVLVRRAVERCNLRNGRPWNLFEPRLVLTAADFASLDDAVARGPREPGGALPVSGFLRPTRASCLIGRGTRLGLPAELLPSGMPDLGAYPAG